MRLLAINTIDTVDLERVECVRIRSAKEVSIIISGHEYRIDEANIKDFLDAMSKVENGIGLTQQFTAV